MRSATFAENISKTPGARMNSPLPRRSFRRVVEVMGELSGWQRALVQLAVDIEEDRGGDGRQRDQEERERHHGEHVVRLHGLDQHVADAALGGEHLADHVPSSVNAKPRRKPDTISGIVAGMTMVAAVWSRERRIAFAARK